MNTQPDSWEPLPEPSPSSFDEFHSPTEEQQVQFFGFDPAKPNGSFSAFTTVPFPKPPKPITVATTSGVLSEVNDEDCINVAKWWKWMGETSCFHKTVRELMLAGF